MESWEWKLPFCTQAIKAKAFPSLHCPWLLSPSWNSFPTWLTEPQSSGFASWLLTLGLLYWFLILSYTLCFPNSVTAAQLFSIYWGLAFSNYSLRLPTSMWAAPTSRTLYLASAGSAFLPELLVAGSFSSLSSPLKCHSSASLLYVPCAICPSPYPMRLFDIYLIAYCLSPHLSVNSTHAETLSGLFSVLSPRAWNSNCDYSLNEITPREFLWSSPFFRLFRETKLKMLCTLPRVTQPGSEGARV